MSKDGLLLDVMQVRSMCNLVTTPKNFKIINNSLERGLCHVFQHKNAGAIGYVLWAKISVDTLRCMEISKKLPLYPYEWNEGELTLITDVVILKRWSKRVVLELLKLKSEHSSICYLRREQLKVVNNDRVNM